MIAGGLGGEQRIILAQPGQTVNLGGEQRIILGGAAAQPGTVVAADQVFLRVRNCFQQSGAYYV